MTMHCHLVNYWLALFFLFVATIPACSGAGINKTLSSKKGLAVSKKNYLCGDLSAFSSISWYYNWGTAPSEEDHPECGEDKARGFVPMIWGYYGGGFPELEFDTVLGFNEPNHHNQANLEPEEAAYAWLEMQAAYPDKILVSPSASPPNTEEWFDAFFEVCEVLGCRVDYLATHSYSGNPEHDINYINGLYQR